MSLFDPITSPRRARLNTLFIGAVVKVEDANVSEPVSVVHGYSPRYDVATIDATWLGAATDEEFERVLGTEYHNRLMRISEALAAPNPPMHDLVLADTAVMLRQPI